MRSEPVAEGLNSRDNEPIINKFFDKRSLVKRKPVVDEMWRPACPKCDIYRREIRVERVETGPDRFAYTPKFNSNLETIKCKIWTWQLYLPVIKATFTFSFVFLGILTNSVLQKFDHYFDVATI